MALKLVLLSAFAQTRLPDEIIVCDDGSGHETALIVQQMKTQSPVPLMHVWQEDRGFRVASSRNKAVVVSTGDYIIQIDGDIIMHGSFISDHLALCRPGHYLKGGRVNLGEELTERLCDEGRLPRINPFTRGIHSKGISAIHLPMLARLLAPRYAPKRLIALACNSSFFRKDFMAVNGYDESFEGWGHEDADLFRRFMRSGITKRHLKFTGIGFHLWHAHNYMQNEAKNRIYANRCENQQPAYCVNGIDRYSGMTPLVDSYGRIVFPEFNTCKM